MKIRMADNTIAQGFFVARNAKPAAVAVTTNRPANANIRIRLSRTDLFERRSNMAAEESVACVQNLSPSVFAIPVHALLSAQFWIPICSCRAVNCDTSPIPLEIDDSLPRNISTGRTEPIGLSIDAPSLRIC